MPVEAINPADVRGVFDRERAPSSLPADRLEFFAGHIHPKTDGHYIPWSFDGHEFLRDVVADQAEIQVRRKAAQLGFSTVEIGCALQDAGACGYNVGYYLPTDDFIERFVQSRFDPLIDADEALATLVVDGDPGTHISAAAKKRRKRADRTQLKHIGRGQLWFFGCQNMGDVKSVDLDKVVRDEVDELNPEFSSFIADRILHSRYRRQVALSQPSVPGFGIDAEFEASDQKHWLLRCNRCRKWTCLEDSFPDCLIQVRGEWRLVCSSCHARLPYLENVAAGVYPADEDRGGRRVAQWVARHPGRGISGVHGSQLWGPHTNAAMIAQQWAKAQRSRRERERFTISILGYPFAGDRQPVGEEVFSGACNPTQGLTWRAPDGVMALWAGIDVGDTLYLTIDAELEDGSTQTIWFETFTGGEWGTLERRLRDAGVRFFIIDARPEKTAAKKLCRSDGLTGAICYFPQGVEQPTFGIEDEKTRSPVHYCKAPRDDVLDDLCDEIINGERRFPAAKHDVMGLVKAHFRNLVKDKTDQGRWAYKRGVENHFALAQCYSRLARLMARGLGLGPITHLAGGEWTVPREEMKDEW